MLIAVNTRFLIKDKLEGIGWFTYETMKRLTRNHPEHQFLFLFDRDFDEEFIFSDNIIPIKVWPPARHPYLWKYWYDYALPQIFRKYKPDIFISTDGLLSLKSTVPSILVLHDLAYIHFPLHIPATAFRYLKKFTPAFLKKADKIITVSDYSKNDIINTYKILPDKIEVVYNGANEKYKPLAEDEKIKVRKEFTGGINYFVYVGSIHPRKNVKNLLLAFDKLKKEGICDHKLLIVGRKAWKTEETFEVYENMEFKSEVIFTGHLQIDKLSGVVGAADALVYPSYFEGFGIPVLEAKYAGIPVICSNTTSLPEVAGDNSIYFNPSKVEEIAEAMIKFIRSRDYWVAKSREASAIRQKFNWDLASNKISNIINEVYDKTRKNRGAVIHS